MAHTLPLPNELQNIIRDYLSPSRQTVEVLRSGVHFDVLYVGEIFPEVSRIPAVSDLIEFLNSSLDPPTLTRQEAYWVQDAYEFLVWPPD